MISLMIHILHALSLSLSLMLSLLHVVFALPIHIHSFFQVIVDYDEVMVIMKHGYYMDLTHIYFA